MFSLIKIWKNLKKNGVMGINQRNADYILKYNQRKFYPLVDDKILTKQKAVEANISAPELYAIISNEHDIANFGKIVKDINDFVIKPARGSGGDGIIVISEHFGEDRFKTVSGKILHISEIEYQLSNIITGLYSLGGERDSAIIEYRVKPDPIFKSISHEGVPDLRVIVLKGYPIMAMLRLPTRQSGGKANLHQGAIGVGIDLKTGTTLNGTWGNEPIESHPDTSTIVKGIKLPMWNEFLRLATSCYELVHLGYIGVDLVLDEKKGPMILEINARPGLNIQIANNVGLYLRAHEVEKRLKDLEAKEIKESISERIEFCTSKLY